MKRLNTEILLVAYSNGFFPMPHPQTDEICWFNPDPRAIIPLDSYHVSKSLRRTLRKGIFTATADQDFQGVIAGCANREETWINREIREAYVQLHRDGYAHSIEIWHEGTLAGGVYGVALGAAFFAESKFHRVADASKAALYHLVEHLRKRGFQLLEVQFLIPHLARLGAVEIPASIYQEKLRQALSLKPSFSEFNPADPP